MKKGIIIFALLLFSAFSVCAQSAFPNDDDPKILLSNLEIFPNPANEFVQISLNNHFSKLQVELYSIIGTKIDVDQEVIEGKSIRLDISSLPQGYYLIAMQDPETKLKRTCKFVVK